MFVTEVIMKRAAAIDARAMFKRYAERIEHGARGLVDGGIHNGLRATTQ